jgi:hypothetical protein
VEKLNNIGMVRLVAEVLDYNIARKKERREE